MKCPRIISIAVLMLLVASASAFAQKRRVVNDTLTYKTGWTWSGLPAISYSTETGVQIGALGHAYFHGDGSHYPQPIHDIGFEASYFTKGRTRAYVSYDSRLAVENLRISASLSYINDPVYPFYGFNGAAQSYNSGLGSISFAMQRNWLRGLADVQGVILPHFNWAAGLAYWGLWTGEISDKRRTDILGDRDPSVYYQSNNYYNYVKDGLIRPHEAKGGQTLELKAGLSYDTRNIEAAPSKGIWAELFAFGSPNIFGSGFNYLKLAAHFRHYIGIPLEWKGGGMVFAYHLAYQGLLAGEAPFYLQQNLGNLVLRQMVSEGLGGYSSLRGTTSARIIANGYAWANIELRVKLFSFKLLNQFFYVGITPFFDLGVITQPYRADEHYAFIRQHQNPDLTREQYNKLVYRPQTSAGAGLKIGWNENFVLTIDVARCLDRTHGMDDGLWIDLNTGFMF